jgi:type I restriction enzyme S subunit
MKKYDSYKDSGIEWIGEIPGHWEVKKLKHIFNNINSIRVPLSAEERGKMVSRVYDYYGASGVIDQVENYLFDEENILIGEDGANLLTRSKRLAFIASGKYWVNNHAHIIKPKTGNIRFFCELLEMIDYSIWVTGSAQPKLTQEALMNIQLLEPPIEEQTIIANYLDHKTTQIDHLIAKKEQFIQLLEEERIAVINQAVTKGLDPSVPLKHSGIEWLGEIPKHWEVKKLKQIFNSSKGLTITKENLESEGIPCVNYGEIHSKFGFEVDIEKHQLKCVNATYLDSDYKSLIQTGDFVFADTSEDIVGAGNFTYLKSNHEIFAGYHTIILRALENIESRYFAYQFDSIPFRTQIRQSVKGIKVFSITQGILKNTCLWIPELDEQRQIIEFLDIETERIVSLKNSTRKEIELLKEYKTALISEVVTGKVDVRNEKMN